MAQVINTNLASLNAQRNLNSSQSALSTSLERLSSGLRINSAKDDAAGLAISQRFTAQIRGGDQAARNANDAISLSQTAEGDLVQISSNLQRLRELAVQSVNATNSTTDRAALQSEATQLIAEIDRVASNSKFNGVSLLDGTFVAQQFQVGANAGQTITVSSINSARSAALGASYSASRTSTTVTGTALSSGDLILNGVTVGASTSDGVSSTNATASAKAKAAAINAASGTCVTATVNSFSVLAGATVTGASALAANDLKINNIDVGVVAGGAQDTQGANIATAINNISAASGVTATYDSTAHKLTLTATDGRNIDVVATAAGTTASGYSSATTYGTISLASTSTTGITVAGATPANAGLTALTTAAAQTGVSIANLDISNLTGANAAITSVDSALSAINTSRASLGSYQNRFSSVVASLQTASENLSAARSRIQDADFAQETANLTRNQVLQQAGVAILAQANALPNSVLQLLK